MASLVIIKTGDAFPEVVEQHGDFEQLFIDQVQDALPDHLTLDVWDARLTSQPPDKQLLKITVLVDHFREGVPGFNND